MTLNERLEHINKEIKRQETNKKILKLQLTYIEKEIDKLEEDKVAVKTALNNKAVLHH